MISNFYISPVHGTFEVPILQARLDSMPDAVADPRQSNRYFLTGYSTLADSAYVAMRQSETFVPFACAILFGPDEVFIQNEFGHAEDARSGADFARWLCSRYPCRLRHEFGRDITNEVEQRGLSYIFGEVFDLPFAWERGLLPLGRFREIDRYDFSTGSSLDASKRPTPSQYEAEILQYLQNGVLLKHTGEEAIDAYDGEQSLGQLEYFTDGRYVWPSDLAHYISAFHVRLPQAFIIHAMANDWKVPTVDVATLPPIPP